MADPAPASALVVVAGFGRFGVFHEVVHEVGDGLHDIAG